MATLVKQKNRRYWYASYRDRAGKQHLYSTKIEHTPPGKDPKDRARLATENRRIAMEHAMKLEEAERGNATEAHLRKVVAEISERLHRQRMEFPTVQSYLKGWLAGLETSEGTRIRYTGTVNAFIESMGDRALLTIDNVNPDDIRAFRKCRLADGRSPSTVSTDLKSLNIPFNAALREGRILTNPVAASFSRNTVKSEERKPFTLAEVEKLVKATSGTEWETAIHFAAYAGMRLGDAVSMKWENVNLFQKTVTFRPKKTARNKGDMEIPLLQQLENHLLSLESPNDKSQYITPSLAEKPSSGKSGLSMQFSRIMKRAGIEQSSVQSTGEKSRTFNRKSFHSLRHYFITRLEEKGIAPDLRMKLAGHADIRSHGRYTHTELETLRKAVSDL